MGQKRRAGSARGRGGKMARRWKRDPVPMDSEITLSADSVGYLKDLAAFYQRGLYCDAELICGGDGKQISCHRVVLASVSTFLDGCFRLECSDEDVSRVLLPDHGHRDVKHFLDGVYGCLGSNDWVTSAELLRYQAVADTLRVDFVPWSFLDPQVVMTEEVMQPSDDVDSDESLASTSFIKESNAEETKFEAKPTEKAEPPCPISLHPQWLQAEARRLEEVMRDCDGKDLVVTVKKSNAVKVAKLKAKERLFMAALGVKVAGGGGELLATPLAWSPGPDSEPSPSEYFRQYKRYSGAIQAVFGLSDAEAHYYHIRRTTIESPAREYMSRRAHRHDMATFSEEQLQEVLDEVAEAKVLERGHAKPAFGKTVLVHKEETTLLKLARDLDDPEGVMVLVLDSAGQLKGRFFKLSKAISERLRQQSAFTMVRTLNNVWQAQNGKSYIPKSKEYLNHFKKLSRLVERHEVAQTFLKDSDGTMRKALVSEEQCQICDKVFQLRNSRDRRELIRHRTEHKYLDHKCDCAGDFNSNRKAKIRHVKLMHMEGFTKCELCDMVFSQRSSVALHMETWHQEMACEYCGAKLKNSMILRGHVLASHPEVKVTNKITLQVTRSNLSGTCDVCGQHYKNVANHRRAVHSAKDKLCPYCGKAFTQKAFLNAHVKKVHGKLEDQFVCPKCNKGFGSKPLIKNHYISVHLKLLCSFCRYEGCDNVYTDSSIRGNHERLAHGRTYLQAAKLGLVPKEPSKIGTSAEYYRVYKELDSVLFASKAHN